MVIDLVQGFRTKIIPTHKANIGLIYPDAKYLVIRIPDSRVLLFLARSVILALVIISVPWLNSLVPITSSTANEIIISSSQNPKLELVPVVFRDLAEEGLIKTGHGKKVVFVSNNGATQSSEILKDNEMDLISVNDENSVGDQSVDFAFVSVFPSAVNFIERTLKVGGIVAVQLSEEPSVKFRMPPNYKMVYLRKFDATTVMAMRKMSSLINFVSAATTTSATRRRLLSEDAKKEALKNLEDVLLEPPRAKSGKSSRYLKKTRYLPDLMGDSLEGYPRRVFIDVGGSGSSWFAKNYPRRNKNFEMYKIETTLTDESKGIVQTSMSGWLEKNVREEEYVVMKAEAEVVEEMMQGKVMNLVDELFLECKPQGHNGKGNNVSTRRAYWQCLALYGQLRDEGVAVHQWWG